MTTESSTTAEKILKGMDAVERTQTWTADRAGLSYPTFRRKLAGGGDFTVPEVARIAKALGMHPIELLPDEFHVAAVGGIAA